jgi:hypothetical protein
VRVKEQVNGAIEEGLTRSLFPHPPEGKKTVAKKEKKEQTDSLLLPGSSSNTACGGQHGVVGVLRVAWLG